MYEKYENLEMEWVDHHNPDLVVLNDDGSERERIDLMEYQSYDGKCFIS
jgi:hypothetical protein